MTTTSTDGALERLARRKAQRLAASRRYRENNPYLPVPVAERKRRGPKPKPPLSAEERRARNSENAKRWRAANPERAKALNDKTNGRLKAEWAAARAQRDPMSLLKTGIGTPLSLFLAEQCIAEDCSLGDLTVMADQTDPFRFDRGYAHTIGKWFAEHLEKVAPGRNIHIRAIHYALLGHSFVQPNKNIYVNTDEIYTWLNEASRAARWLRYVPFDRITDERNETPLVLVPEETRHRAPEAWVRACAPSVSTEMLLPEIEAYGAVAPQPYRLALIAEKSSAREELEPLARRYGTELLLPSGHLSDRLIYDMAKRASRDGRPLVCLYATDCDPSGWSMPVVLARKLQAHKILHFSNLNAVVHHVGLTPDQVREFELPDSVLKEGDKKAVAWREAFGLEQVELDSLIGRHPGALAAAFEEVIGAYFDPTLKDRLREQVYATETGLNTALRSTDEWREAARVIRENIETLQSAIKNITEAQAAVRALEIGRIDWRHPKPSIEQVAPDPLFDSERPWSEQARFLKARRAFDDGADDE